MARVLTTSDFGVVNAVVAAAGLAAQCASFGITDVGSRDIAASPERTQSLVALVQSIRMAVLVIFVPVAVLMGIWFGWPATTVLLGALMAISLGASADWALRGLEQMNAVAKIAAIGGFTVLAVSMLLLLAGGSVELAIAAFALGEAVSAALTWRILLSIGTRPRFTLAGAAGFIKDSWIVAASGFVAYIYFSNADSLLLIALRGSEETGLYSAAYRLFLAAATVSLLAAWALMPALTRQVTSDLRAEALTTRGRTMWLLLAYGGVVLGLAELFAHPVLTTVFGEPFGAMDDVLVILCIGLVWYTVGYPLGYGSIADDEPERLLPGAVTAGVLNVALALILIPQHGAIGAAWATAGAFAAGGVTWLMQARIKNQDRLRALSMLAIVSVGAVGTVIEPSLRGPVGITTVALAVAVLSRRSLYPRRSR